MNEGPNLRLWVSIAALCFLHFVLHVAFAYGRGAPDLLTLALLLAVREVGLAPAGLLGLFFGLLEDSLSVLAFGANTLAMTVVALGGAFTRDLFVGDSRTFIVSYLFIGKWIRDLVHWTAVGQGLRQPFVEQVLVQGGIASLYVAAVGIIVSAVNGLGGES